MLSNCENQGGNDGYEKYLGVDMDIPPTPSMTSLLAARPFCQCVSHSRRLPGCSV